MDTFHNWQKSSFSGPDDGNNCVELTAMRTPTPWQKSSFSGPDDGNDCVEVAATPATLHLRESDTPTSILTTAANPLAHLLHGIKTGRLA